MAKHIIIPARLQSTRLANKLLLDLAGKPIIEHVHGQALKCDFAQVIIATDSQEIKTVVESFGGQVCLTRDDHQSGTDRIAEVVETLNIAPEDIVVNIQGDEPLIPVENVQQSAELLIEDERAVMATLCERIADSLEVFDPNCVKVIMDKQGHALYFSRAPIPWHRGHFDRHEQQLKSDLFYRHIGLYAYRAHFLQRYAKMEKSPIEAIESLEQLRVLWHGGKIAVAEARSATPPGIDTAKDLQTVRALYRDL